MFVDEQDFRLVKAGPSRVVVTISNRWLGRFAGRGLKFPAKVFFPRTSIIVSNSDAVTLGRQWGKQVQNLPNSRVGLASVRKPEKINELVDSLSANFTVWADYVESEFDSSTASIEFYDKFLEKMKDEKL